MAKKGNHSGDKNLIPMNKLTEDEQREMARKGGKASVEARRKKKNMQEVMRTLMELKPVGSSLTVLKTIGFDEEDMTNMAAFASKLYSMAMNGNLQAAEMCMRLGVLSAEEERKEKESEARIAAMNKEGNNITIESGETSRVQIYLPEIEKIGDDGE